MSHKHKVIIENWRCCGNLFYLEKKKDYNSCFTCKWCKRNPKIVKFHKKNGANYTKHITKVKSTLPPQCNRILLSFLSLEFLQHASSSTDFPRGWLRTWLTIPSLLIYKGKRKEKKTVKCLSFSIWYQFLKFEFDFYDNKPQSPSPFFWSYFLLSRYVSSVIGRSRKKILKRGGRKPISS